MSDERLIMAAIVTNGEKSDGKYLQELIEKSQETGMVISTVIGDTAYSEKDNIHYVKENELQLLSKLNPQITQGSRTKEDEFEFNKDAGIYVCKAGNMAIRKARQGKRENGSNPRIMYYFDIEKCKGRPLREGCYKEGAKIKPILSPLNGQNIRIRKRFNIVRNLRRKPNPAIKSKRKIVS